MNASVERWGCGEICVQSMLREITDKLGDQPDKDQTVLSHTVGGNYSLSVIVLAMTLTSAGSAANGELPGAMSDAALREQGFTPLLHNNSLAAWNVQPWHEGHWTLQNGVINYDGTAKHADADKISLWTKHDFGNLKLYAEWRLPSEPRMKPQPIVLFNGDFLLDDAGKRITRPGLDAGDSGILLRGTSKCQANIWSQELGSGEINGYRTDQTMPPAIRRACIPIKKADQPLGEWNVFLIKMQGDRMTVDLNGERVIDAARLPEVPKSGPIGLQHHGDPVQFRQVWIKELH